MSNTIIIDPQSDGTCRAVAPNGDVWLFDLESSHQLWGALPAQSDHGECGSDTLEISNTIMGEHIEN